MRALLGLNWRMRTTLVATLAVASALMLTAASDFADAGNPILGSIKASTVDTANGTPTADVRGQWNWLSHTSDCNSDRAATGLAVIWNDTTEPGYQITNGALSARVGVAS